MSKSTVVSKSVRFAPAASKMAEHFFMAKTGCWYIVVTDKNDRSKPLVGFREREEAVDYAKVLPYPFDSFSAHEEEDT